MLHRILPGHQYTSLAPLVSSLQNQSNLYQQPFQTNPNQILTTYNDFGAFEDDDTNKFPG